MTNTVYLHIGMNKTGSSAIQHYLSNNRQNLADNGVLYPKTGSVGNAHYHLSTMLGFTYGKPEVVDVNSTSMRVFKQTLDDEIKKVNLHDVVLSSEYFVQMRPVETVKSFFEGYDVKVVVYLRRHDKWWASAYNQAVRTAANPPWGRTFRAYLNFFEKKRPWIGSYRMLLDRWAEVFGKENMIVRPYERQQNEHGLIHDFMRAIGKECVVQEVVPLDVRVNDSIVVTTLSFVDACQRARIDPEIRASLIRHALENRDPMDDSVSFAPGLMADLAVKHQDDYDYIAREYLGREDGKLFYEQLPEPSAEWTRGRPPTLDSVIESVVSVMQDVSSGDSVLMAHGRGR